MDMIVYRLFYYCFTTVLDSCWSFFRNGIVAQAEIILTCLRQEIVEGHHGGINDRFMAVRELAERFSVSLTTAHKVIGQLKSEGLLTADSTNRARISSKAAKLAAISQQSNPQRLGLVVTNIASPFFGSLCRHIQQSAATMNYQVLVASSDYDFDRERKAIESFLEIGVQGLLICPGLTDDSVSLYRNLLAKTLAWHLSVGGSRNWKRILSWPTTSWAVPRLRGTF